MPWTPFKPSNAGSGECSEIGSRVKTSVNCIRPDGDSHMYLFEKGWRIMQQPITKVLIAAVAMLVLFSLTPQSPAGRNQQYYVAPNGSDKNDGTLDHPWKTLKFAVSRLSPGDTLDLRGGTYPEHDLTIKLKGTADAPITIESYPGERAVIDGSFPGFKSAPNTEWELVNEEIGLYRSKITVSGRDIRAWLLDDNVQLVTYQSEANLESTNYGPVQGKAPLYIGPGVQLRSDGHVYLRLQPNPNDLIGPTGLSIPPTPRDTNPNNQRIALFSADHTLRLDGAAYLKLRGLDLTNAIRGIDTKNGAHHVEIDDCRIAYGSYGIVARSGIHDWNIHDSAFENGVPDNVYWTDVKNGSKESAEAYPEFQSAAISGPIPGFEIKRNTFNLTFDALDIKDGSNNLTIADNEFTRIRDDAIELDKGISNVEIAHNLFWHVGSGVSINPSTSPAGSVYIHHNVIDNSAYQHGGRPGNYRESDWPVWTTIDPFASHGSGDSAAAWKLYNNTIVTRRSGYDWHGAGPDSVTGNLQKYVYNNIFYIIDDRIVFRDDLASSGSHYDGDVIYRGQAGRYPLFYHFGDGGDYSTLADFQSRSDTGWEAQGLEVDPGFVVSLIDNPTFDPATIWDRYRPTDSRVLTAGVPYVGLDWPGTDGVNYRGALPPAPTG